MNDMDDLRPNIYSLNIAPIYKRGDRVRLEGTAQAGVTLGHVDDSKGIRFYVIDFGGARPSVHGPSELAVDHGTSSPIAPPPIKPAG